jgi:6-pyruvoyl-tetrahydropterin synthase related domain
MVRPRHSLAAFSASSRWGAALLLSFVVSLAIVSPFLWLGSASGHDFQFHISSWLDVAGQWKQGILFPRWSEWANYGYGEPRFVFYPPLSWLLGAALGSLLPWPAVAGAFIVVVQTFAGGSAYALARRFVTHRPALIAAAGFTANPYALLIVYRRSDYAELLAIALYPFLLLVCLRLCGWLDGETRAPGREVTLFALPFAAIWLSNAPAGVVASYAVVLVFAWAAVTRMSWAPLLRGAAALALGFALAAFYLLPAAYEQPWVNIAQALSPGVAPADNFLFTAIRNPAHDAFNRLASAVALLMIALTLCAVLAAWHRLKPAAAAAGAAPSLHAWQALAVLSAASALLMVRFTLPLWTWLPKLRFVQFPWRWMSVLAVVFAVTFPAAIAGRRRAWIAVAALFLVLAGTAAYLARGAWWDEEDFSSIHQAIEQGSGYEGTDEYDPVGDDHYDLPRNQPRARALPAIPSAKARPQAAIRVERWTAQDRILLVSARDPVRLAVRLLDYPAWRVTVNGAAVVPQHEGGIAAMILPLAAGVSHIEIRFSRTPDRTLGGLISLFALGLAVGLARSAGRVGRVDPRLVAP